MHVNNNNNRCVGELGVVIMGLRDKIVKLGAKEKKSVEELVKEGDF